MSEFFDNEEYEEVEEVEPIRRDANTRRKNEWKYASRRKAILNNHITKPLHYYSKNMPESNAVDKRQIRKSKQQLENFKSQINDLEEQFEEC